MCGINGRQDHTHGYLIEEQAVVSQVMIVHVSRDRGRNAADTRNRAYAGVSMRVCFAQMRVTRARMRTSCYAS